MFEGLKIPPVNIRNRKKKSDRPSVDKVAMEHWLATLPERSKGAAFVRNLRNYRKRTTALSYITGYRRFGISEGRNWIRLHPSLNSTGSDTLRWSSSNPNEQNISKQEGFNLRYAFGPLPGREWWSMDAKNIELRIPAYEAGEQEMIQLFERPDDPPYYGSNHLLNFHTVYPDIWDKELKAVGFEKVGPHCKKKYAGTWYQYCKNGGFGVQYGAMDREDGQGTADQAFHRPGSHAKLKERFSRLEAHNQWCIDYAESFGYIETVPDHSVDPLRGYPILCTRTQWGGILPTVPLNYRTQGTAMWWMCMAMIRCQDQLDKWNRGVRPEYRYYLVMQVHDELVFDFPAPPPDYKLKDQPWTYNGSKIAVLKGLMEQGGTNISIPTPVGVAYHADNWSEDVTI
jgi:hypothetical protein